MNIQIPRELLESILSFLANLHDEMSGEVDDDSPGCVIAKHRELKSVIEQVELILEPSIDPQDEVDLQNITERRLRQEGFLNDSNCTCFACVDKRKDPKYFSAPGFLCRMVACSCCSNKRCPKAANHIWKCTNSNESDQEFTLDELPKQLTPAEKKEAETLYSELVEDIKNGDVWGLENNSEAVT